MNYQSSLLRKSAALFLTILFTISNIAFAETVSIEDVSAENANIEVNNPGAPLTSEDFAESKTSDTDLEETTLSEAEKHDLERKKDLYLQRLNSELNMSRSDYFQVSKNIVEVEARLKIVHEERGNLASQLKNIDDLTELTLNKLNIASADLVELENLIILLDTKIIEKQKIQEFQKSLLEDYIRTMYLAENDLFITDKTGNVNTLKLLLSDSSISENISNIQYLELLNQAGLNIYHTVESLNQELYEDRSILDKKRQELEVLKENLQREKDQLKIQKEAKENLLKITAGQEQIYSQLFEQTLREKSDLLSIIAAYTSSMQFINQKILEEGANFNPDLYVSLLDPKTAAVYKLSSTLNLTGMSGFSWPVAPYKGISAHFRDSSYVGVFGVRHNAVDIPTFQKNPVRAAADSIVYTVKDNGYGYSYIILAHAGGFMTVYGHISEILVAEGQYVPSGFVIGLSGGMPGTKGAGYMTTGPHLHFEMLLNGEHIDPLEYLNLTILTEDQVDNLPDHYKERWKKEREALLGLDIDPIALPENSTDIVKD